MPFLSCSSPSFHGSRYRKNPSSWWRKSLNLTFQLSDPKPKPRSLKSGILKSLHDWQLCIHVSMYVFLVISLVLWFYLFIDCLLALNFLFSLLFITWGLPTFGRLVPTFGRLGSNFWQTYISIASDNNNKLERKRNKDGRRVDAVDWLECSWLGWSAAAAVARSSSGFRWLDETDGRIWNRPRPRDVHSPAAAGTCHRCMLVHWWSIRCCNMAICCCYLSCYLVYRSLKLKTFDPNNLSYLCWC